MNLIKQYKTIWILVALIIVFGIIAVFAKVLDTGRVQPSPKVKVGILLTPTSIPDPFIHPEDFKITSSYMGYAVVKVVNPDLGKAVLKYGSKNVDLDGSEWTIKKSGVSDFEYSQVKPYINNAIQGQLVKQGWLGKATVNGQVLIPNLSKVFDLNQGYVETYNGKVQVAILEGGKDNLGNVNFKLFLSNIYDLTNL
jgi:hypothetical protein